MNILFKPNIIFIWKSNISLENLTHNRIISKNSYVEDMGVDGMEMRGTSDTATHIIPSLSTRVPNDFATDSMKQNKYDSLLDLQQPPQPPPHHHATTIVHQALPQSKHPSYNSNNHNIGEPTVLLDRLDRLSRLAQRLLDTKEE